ncbi:MIP/aquaporin family protein [Streptomyces sp. NPDC000994]
MTAKLWRRLAAEAIGTALLVIFGAGSFVAALVVGKGQLGYAAIGIIGFSFAFVIAAAVYVFGPISGAHINPAVTIALAAIQRFPWREVVPYVVAQLGGALGGGLLVNVIFGSSALTANVSGGTVVQPGHTYLQAGVAEALGTALLLFTIMALAVDARAPTGWAGLIIGLVVACEIMVIGPISNGSVNPARTFGPYAATTIFGGHTPWQEFWLYCVGPVIGAVVAAVAYVFVAQPRPSTPPLGRTSEAE